MRLSGPTEGQGLEFAGSSPVCRSVTSMGCGQGPGQGHVGTAARSENERDHDVLKNEVGSGVEESYVCRENWS